MYSESNVSELKRELTDVIKKEIIAFLNTKGGVIYVGVDDDGNLYKPFLEEDRDDVSLRLSSWLQNTISPLPSNLVSFSFNDEGVLAIEVKEGPKKPYYLKEKGPKPSGTFKRIGTSSRTCSEEEILQMIMESSHYVYESDVSEEQDLTFKFLARLFEDRGMTYSEKQSFSLGIRAPSGVFTNLGLLLSDQSPVEVKVAEYDRDMGFKLKRTFSGSLLKVLSDVQEQASRLNDVSATIDGKTWVRTETKSYPGESLREIILNAFCHANYFIRSNIKVEFYPDKAKITSPGGLFKSSIEEMMMGVQTYRNERLVHVLDKLGYIENFGTGIPRTMAAYQSYALKPQFYSSENFFVATLPNVNYKADQINDQINDQISDQISDLGLEVLRIVQRNPGIKVSGIHEELAKSGKAVTLDSIRNVIKRDIRGYIKLIGSRKTGGYHIKGKPEEGKR